MNQVLVLLVGGVALVVLVLLAVTSLAGVGPHLAGPRLRGFFARVVCPETDTLQRVGIGVVTENERAVPQVLSCERFASGPVTCDRACLQQVDAPELSHSSAALA
ncbi:MAG: hypothetical protein HY700_10575 [Gemmatimonadetes bacterium]|nr:hypothetical protein [Gemmatimonadota bacterium]